ncbi:hypothetical protein CPAST_c25120 [Clostridium pasteurianum DSM 525 = ATCC 6013]|uniref:SAM-dependent methyltransferase n=1 Tax=Clostridium pasteurianum DSM 525 = ATCC 6013 TaxID=1262449 RepID=A0A0H3J3S9_CLOPA|nr:hypothetical protein [Clostridium pasteurianum]AJA48581.1 hypothetical protein CPAST_c25120 [Clostridium pasteurianum DSM 525 = ATCC 6013]AJA52569.1 hypothetical protein CLPA_c25120 [Clostridium pasteurianum DSM 525 = ATCC 6013]AOZ75812.1 hypothetical protein AQ983_12200 [Clostridium pasteurianum DSM 525 = ATCC 6013]AOZ79608.1 hypothetical protein AQ984_12195 [Clostridium pasteurianum]ELP57941.1 hypothetical protein F502_17110 [Clostridium pasteurianum DSM 525 = ATCC 6013]
MNKKLQLNDFVLIGRTFEEYYKMFDLKDFSKSERILDVASGVSSFCAEANAKGYNVTAADRVYAFNPEEIEEKCAKDLEETMEKVSTIKELYKWNFFKDIEQLKSHRERAYRGFIKDFKLHKEDRYISSEFPSNNFKGNQFDISLISHFLFLYDEHMSYEFHKQIINEIIRITKKEIRIFPIANLKAQRSPFIEKFMKDKAFNNYEINIVKVNYEFIKAGNEMLVVKIKQ